MTASNSNFGKGYTVAANSIPIKALSLLLLISSVYADSSSASNANTIIDYAKRQVAVRTAELGERISICDKQKESAAIPDIQYAKLIGTGVTKQQTIAALTHLSDRNYALCEGRAREALAFALGTLSALATQYKLDVESIEGIENNLIYPSGHDIELEIEFSNLNDEVKSLLLNAVGDQPFNLLKTLRKSKLITDQ